MAAGRKLQAEIEKTLKKVDEGIEEFNHIWDSVHAATHANQREKFESELKSQIKKLQRDREQIKAWQTDKTIKDKNGLAEARKKIEIEMERFKEFERDLKTKQYSKEGLSKQKELDPHEEERRNHRLWIQDSIDKLNLQVDEMSADVERQLGVPSSAKKKKDKVAEESPEITHLRHIIETHRWHVQKLEQLLRRLNNDGVDLGQVGELKENVDFYVEDNSRDADAFNEFDAIYEGFGLEAIEDWLKKDSGELKAEDFDAVSSLGDRPESSHGGDSHKEREKASKDDPKAPSKHVAAQQKPPSSPGPAVSRRHVPTVKEEGEDAKPAKPASQWPPMMSVWQNPAPAPQPQSEKAPPPAPSVGPPPAPSKPGPPVQRAAPSGPPPAAPTAERPPPPGQAPVLNNPPNQPPSKAPPKPAPHQPPNPPPTQAVPPPPPVAPLPPRAGPPGAAAPAPPPLPPPAPQATVGVSVGEPPTSAPPPPPPPAMPPPPPTAAPPASAAAVLQRPPSLPPPAAKKPPTGVEREHPVGPPPAPSEDYPREAREVPKVPPPTGAPPPPSESPPPPPPPAEREEPVSPKSRADAVMSLGAQLAEPAGPPPKAPPPPAGQLPPRTSPAAASSSTAAPRAQSPELSAQRGFPRAASSSASAGADATDVLSPQRLHVLDLLEASFSHLPSQADGRRKRKYFPRNPYLHLDSSQTPAYPTQPPANYEELFDKYDLDTLFFIFYYQQGSYQQHLAAKELKRLSWRFHTGYLTWFQRHEEPKQTAHDFERGAYVYFDHDMGWCKRVKEDFSFYYEFLEDEPI